MKTFTILLVLFVAGFVATGAIAQTESISLGNFSNGTAGTWGMQAWQNGTWDPYGDASTNMFVAPINGVNALVGVLSATTTSPINYDTDAGLVTTWNSTGQAALFNTADPLSLEIDFVNYTAAQTSWITWITIECPDGTQAATSWEFWPNSTMTFTAADFGISNAEFATMSYLQLTLPSYGATNGTGGYVTPSVSLAFTGAELYGTAAPVPEPASLGTLLLGLCGVAGTYLRKRSA